MEKVPSMRNVATTVLTTVTVIIKINTDIDTIRMVTINATTITTIGIKVNMVIIKVVTTTIRTAIIALIRVKKIANTKDIAINTQSRPEANIVSHLRKILTTT